MKLYTRRDPCPDQLQPAVGPPAPLHLRGKVPGPGLQLRASTGTQALSLSIWHLCSVRDHMCILCTYSVYYKRAPSTVLSDVT